VITELSIHVDPAPTNKTPTDEEPILIDPQPTLNKEQPTFENQQSILFNQHLSSRVTAPVDVDMSQVHNDSELNTSC
jgi:hypothetical protein